MDHKAPSTSLRGGNPPRQSRVQNSGLLRSSQRHTRAQRVAVSIINFYQKYLSLDTGIFSLKKGTTCVFYPTCSEYTKEAIMRYGALRGMYLGTRRILRCHPWQKDHIDLLK